MSLENLSIHIPQPMRNLDGNTSGDGRHSSQSASSPQDEIDQVKLGLTVLNNFVTTRSEPPLTPEREKALARQTAARMEVFTRLVDRTGDESWFDIARKIGQETKTQERLAQAPLTPEERYIIAEGEAAIKKLVEDNIRRVFPVARYYSFHTSISIKDLIQEGMLGLMHAAAKFEDRGANFYTHAAWWVRAAITKFIYIQDYIINMPSYIRPEIDRVLKARDELMVSGQETTDAAIAAKLGISVRKVADLFAIIDSYTEPFSDLDMPVNEDETDDDDENEIEPILLKETIAQVPPDPILSERDRGALLGILKEVLKPNQYMVVLLRFGIGDETPLTLGEAGRKLMVTGERVRKIEERAITVLRRPDVRKKLRPFLRY